MLQLKKIKKKRKGRGRERERGGKKERKEGGRKEKNPLFLSIPFLPGLIFLNSFNFHSQLMKK